MTYADTAWCLDLQNQQKYCDFILLLLLCIRLRFTRYRPRYIRFFLLLLPYIITGVIVDIISCTILG